MNQYLLLSILSAFFWATCIIVEKNYLLTQFNPLELLISRGAILILFFFIYLFLTKGNINKKFINMDSKTLFYLVLSFILSFLGVFLSWYVIKNKDASYAVAIVNPLIITFVVLISYFFYKENITIKEAIGILLVLLGITCINYGK